MGKYKDWVHKLPQHKDTMIHLTDITDEFVEAVKITHPQKYTALISKLEKLCSEGHFTKEELEKLHDLYFSIEDTTNYAKETYEIDFDKEQFNKYDFNFIMNEMYKIFNSLYHQDKSKYAELTLSWLDYNEGKAYTYFEKMYKM